MFGDKKTEWRHLPGLPHAILVSEEKEKFITEKLASLVGGDWFWMDVLCVDQADRAARVAVTQHIPTIFWYSQKTIVVRSSGGFQPCCGVAVRHLTEFEAIFEELRKHVVQNHWSGEHGTIREHNIDLNETLLERLWVWQEILLSDRLQFALCDPPFSSQRSPGTNPSSWALYLPGHSTLGTLAMGWYHESIGHTATETHEFVQAFLNCRSVSRNTTKSIRYELPHYDDFLPFIAGTQRTTQEISSWQLCRVIDSIGSLRQRKK